MNKLHTYFTKFKKDYQRQSHYIEVVQGDFFMEQKIRFGLVLGQLAKLEKNGGRLLATFEFGFFMFSRAKK